MCVYGSREGSQDQDRGGKESREGEDILCRVAYVRCMYLCILQWFLIPNEGSTHISTLLHLLIESAGYTQAISMHQCISALVHPCIHHLCWDLVQSIDLQIDAGVTNEIACVRVHALAPASPGPTFCIITLRAKTKQ